MESTDQVLRYNKSSGFAKTQGQDFAMHLTALLFLRGVNSGWDFQFASNVQGAGCLDDIVFRYKTSEQPGIWHTMFIQLKFKEQFWVSRRILRSPKGDFSFAKYFQSYLEIKQAMSTKEKGTLFEGEFDKCTFVIFTNAKARDNLGSETIDNLNQMEELLRSGLGSVFSFAEDREMLDCLGECGDEGEMFLRSLRMFCGQPSGDELEILIRNELSKLGYETLHDIDVGRLLKPFLDNMKDWYAKNNSMLHKNHEVLRSAVRKARLDNSSKNMSESESTFPGTPMDSNVTSSRLSGTMHQTKGHEMEPTDQVLRYNKIPGFATTYSQDFEVHLIALLFLRGVNSGWDYQLASNVQGAGCLDDIAFRVKTSEEPSTWYTTFLQLKWKERSLVSRKMLTHPKGDFSLAKYFQSYLEIKQAMYTKEKGTLFEGEFEKCTFVIFTNAKATDYLGSERSNNLNQMEELLWSGSGNVLSLAEDKEMLECLGECGDEGEMFLKSLRVFCGQPRGSDLEKAIRNELCKINVKKAQNADVERLAEYFLDNVKDWWVKGNDILHKDHYLFRSAFGRAWLETLSRKTLEEYRLSFVFDQSALSPLESSLTDGDAVTYIKSSEITCRLSLTKVIQYLQTRTYLLVFNLQRLLDNEEEVTYKWPGTKYATVIIVLDTTIESEEKISLLREKINGMSVKSRLVIVASTENWELILKLSSEVSHYFPSITYCDTFDYSQIHQQWISSLQSLQLQEIQTSFTSLLFGNSKGLEKIDVSLVEEMISANINGRSFGPPLVAVDSNHVTDTIELRNVLKSSLFRETALSETVMVILPTVEHVRSILLEADPNLTPQDVENALCEFTWSHLSPDVASRSQLLGHDFVLGKCNCKFVGYSKKSPRPDEDSKSNVIQKIQSCADTCKEWQLLEPCFLFVEKEVIKEIAKIVDHQAMDLYELRNGELIWKSTAGSMDLVRRNLDRERVSLLSSNTLIDFPARISVIYAKHGNGQALVDRLAWRTKTQFPGLWMIVIPSTFHAKFLDKEARKNATRFLLAAANIKPGLEEELFKSALDISGEVVVILNCLGVGDPMEEDWYSDFLASLRKKKAKRICIVTESKDLTVKWENVLKTIAMELR